MTGKKRASRATSPSPTGAKGGRSGRRDTRSASGESARDKQLNQQRGISMDRREQAVVPPQTSTSEALMEPPRPTPEGPQLQPVLQSDPQETPKKAKPPKQTAISSYLQQPGAKTGGADASSSAGSTDGAKQAGASSTIPISTTSMSTATAAAVATSAQAEATATSTVSPNSSLPSADAEVGMEVTGSDDESTLRDEAILSMAAAKVEKEHTPKKKMKVIDKRRALENKLQIKIKEGDEEEEGEGSGEEEESMQVGPHDVIEDGGPTEAVQSPEDEQPAWST